MRVFILALDGLDQDLTAKWKLRNLLQKTHGKILLSKDYCIESKPVWASEEATEEVPFTPIVWTSFITGKHPSQHNIRSLWTYGKFLDKIRGLPLIRHIKGKRKILARLGITPGSPQKNDLGFPTIFDVIKPSIAVWVVAYNEPKAFRWEISKAGKEGLNHLEKIVWKIHKERVKETFKQLNSGNWKLFMTYFELADLMGHIYIVKNPRKLKMYYRILDSLAYSLKEKVEDENTIFLIVSDHGMKPSCDGVTGNHSMEAFWSLNIETEWKPNSITDFFYKIYEWINTGITGNL